MTTEMQDAIAKVISFIGDDPERDGVQETPARVVKSWRELFSGYNDNPRQHLAKRFPIERSEMVSLTGIRFYSTCEHHMLPFHGLADVAYIPTREVCGLSKLARVVDGYARRLQMQETLTEQIATAIEEELQPLGVAVRIRAQHMCMMARGVRSPGDPSMVTTALRGIMLEDPKARSEWLATLG